MTKLGPALEEIHERPAGVVIECLPFADLIRHYDGPEVLFYLDLPYWGSEEDYGAGLFSRSDFEAIAAQLGGIKDRFLLSLNDTPGVREVFAVFTIEEVQTTYQVSGKPKPAREVLIS